MVSEKHIPHNMLSSGYFRNVRHSLIGTIFMDLFKAYECLDISGLNFLLDYLSLKNHRTKVGSSYSKWSKIFRGIPQRSTLSPLLFNIYL